MRAARAFSEIEAAAWRLAGRRFAARALRRAELCAAIRDLSTRYNRLAGSPADPRLLPARLLFFTVSELPKASFALAELCGATRGFAAAVHGRLEAPFAILDVGAGCGALALGAAAFLRAFGCTRPLTVDALDRDRAALALARELAGESGLDLGALGLRALEHELARPLPATCDSYELILAGNAIGELPPARRAPLARELVSRLAPGGALVVVEPALRETSRALHALRDELCASEAVSLVAPCTHCEPCPALARAGDWCHEHRAWPQLPPRLRELAAATRLRRRDLAWSYLTLRAPGDRATSAGAWRVVSAPLASKGKHELYLCGAGARLRASLLARHASGENRAFLAARRGQLLVLEGELERPAPGVLRLTARTRVAVVDPARLALA